MAKIPTYVAKEGLDTSRQTMPRVDVDTSPQRMAGQMGASISRLGEQITGFAAVADRRQQQTAAFTAGIEADRFSSRLQADDTEALKSISESGDGWASSRLENFDRRAQESLASMPAGLQQQYAQRYSAMRDRYANQQAQREFEHRSTWAIGQLDSKLESYGREVRADPGQLQDRQELLREAVRNLPVMDSRKPDLEKAYLGRLQALAAGEVFKADPDGMRRAAGLAPSPAEGVSVTRGPAQDPSVKGWVEKQSGIWAPRAQRAMSLLTGEGGLSPVAAAGLLGNVVQESSLRTSARNAGDGRDGSDSIGIAQWNSSRAQALKRFAAEKGADWQDFDTQVRFLLQELKTTERKTYDRLMNAQTVEEAAGIAVGFFRPRGWNESDPSGSHGFRYRVANAQKIAGLDPVGPETSITTTNGPRPQQDPRFSAVSTQMWDALIRRAEVDRRTEEGNLSVAMKDDLASLERTGVGLPETALSFERIVKVLGEEGAREWELERARASKIYRALDGIDQLPEAEVLRRVQSLEPAPGTEGFVAETKVYERARTKAERFLEARRSDPALSVDALPAVQAARQTAQYDSADGVRTIQPESAQSIVRARFAAQSQLGIQEPMAVTKSEAAVIARQLRLIGQEQPDQLRKFMESLNRTYGDYADEVLAATIQHSNVNRDLSVVASQLLTQIARGSAPQASTMRNVDALIDAAALANIMPPPPLPDALRPPSRSQINSRAVQAARAAQDRVTEAQRGAPVNEPEPPPSPAMATQEGKNDIRRLINDPQFMAEFTRKYGPGVGEKMLKDYARMKGAAQ